MLCTALEMLLFLKSVGLDKKGHTNPRPPATRPNILNTIRKADFTFSKKSKLDVFFFISDFLLQQLNCFFLSDSFPRDLALLIKLLMVSLALWFNILVVSLIHIFL